MFTSPKGRPALDVCQMFRELGITGRPNEVSEFHDCVITASTYFLDGGESNWIGFLITYYCIQLLVRGSGSVKGCSSRLRDRPRRVPESPYHIQFGLVESPLVGCRKA